MDSRPLIVSYFTKQYRQDVFKLIQSANQFGYDIVAYKRRNYDDWFKNCAMKSEVIAGALREHQRPILFLDADCWIKKDLKLEREPDADLALVVSKPEQIKPHFEVMYYKRFAMDHGGMWNSGIIYFDNKPYLADLCDEWRRLCLEYPYHNDQILMQRAFQPHVKNFHAWTIGKDIWAGCSRIGHDSGFHRYWKPIKTYRYLLLGSAPSVVDWWEKHGKSYTDQGFIVCALNNAWKIPGKHLNIWFLPTDFDFQHGRPGGFRFNDGTPEQAYKASWFLVNPPKGTKDWPITGPCWEPNNRTMIVDVLNHILNWTLQREVRCEVHVAGSDLMYDGPQTHFHSQQGGLDPLRFGTEWLEAALKRVQRNYEQRNFEVYNATDAEESRLPFPRRQL